LLKKNRLKGGKPKAFVLQHLTCNLRLRTVCGLLLAAGCSLLLFAACMVGPNYRRPSAPVPSVYKELPPSNSEEASIWKPAQPSEGVPKGKWWEIYHDPQLNQLEEQVNISNQNVLLAEAQFRAARAAVRLARSSLFPTVNLGPTYTRTRTSSTQFNAQLGNLTGGGRNVYDFPVDVTSYEADVWGGIRRTIRGQEATAQASFAQLENARLTYQAELALDYFQLRGSEGERQLLERTVKSYENYLQLTKDRFASGVASGADVAQAQTQLETARAQLIDLGVARAQFEHAIAILTGKPPSELRISPEPIQAPPPPIPVSVPSTLLERRPDIAQAERQMAAANEQIGAAQVAFYPALNLTATGGMQSGELLKWFSWPSRFWSLGPQLVQTVFDAGKRRAQVAQARAAYDATVANYRQTVLTSFQQVEDELAALRVLADEARAEDQAVQAAQQALDISTYQYKAGTASYLQVITAQTALLQNQLLAVNILTRRLTASVLLMEALGGGWDASRLPPTRSLAGRQIASPR
jgi:NodT family efflux transporter outer membrane factor (OMF) lipoprotein